MPLPTTATLKAYGLEYSAMGHLIVGAGVRSVLSVREVEGVAVPVVLLMKLVQ